MILITWPEIAGQRGLLHCIPDLADTLATPQDLRHSGIVSDWQSAEGAVPLILAQVLVHSGILLYLAFRALHAAPNSEAIVGGMVVGFLLLPAVSVGATAVHPAASNGAVIALFSIVFFSLTVAPGHWTSHQKVALSFVFVLLGVLLATTRIDNLPLILVLLFFVAALAHRKEPRWAFPFAFAVAAFWLLANPIVENVFCRNDRVFASERPAFAARPPLPVTSLAAALADPVRFLEVRGKSFLVTLGLGERAASSAETSVWPEGCSLSGERSNQGPWHEIVKPSEIGLVAVFRSVISSYLVAGFQKTATTLPQLIFCIVLLLYYRTYPISAAIALALLSRAMSIFLFAPAADFFDLYDLYVLGLLLPLMLVIEHRERKINPVSVKPRKPRMLLSFGVVSGLGWITDFTIFGVLGSLAVPVWLANFCGASIAVLLVFFLSVRRVFLYQGHYVVRKLLSYTLYQVIAITLASLTIDQIHRLGIHMLLAKIIVTPLTFYCNFQFMSYITTGKLRWA